MADGFARSGGVGPIPLGELALDTSVTALWGVGAERAAQFERLGIRTLNDALLHRPRRYEDRRRCTAIRDLREKGPAVVRGRVLALGVKYFRKRTRSVFELILDDGTARLHCRWWNMPYLEGQFRTGMELMVYGRVTELRPRTMDHPETEEVESEGEAAGEEADGTIHMGRIVPVYPLTEGMTQRWLRTRLWWLAQHVAPRVPEPHPGLARGGLPSRADALRALHFPRELVEAEEARRRLAYDEWVALQFEIQTRRQRLLARAQGVPCAGDNRLIKPFLARLGYALTEAQTAVLRDIRQDLAKGRPMRRLVQGDVGSGKTVVAAATALMAIESGYSVALMAPTEILAQQHEGRFREWFEPLGIRVELRTGGGKSSAAEATLDSAPVFPALVTADPALPDSTAWNDPRRPEESRARSVGASGQGEAAKLTVGTHALIEAGYAPADLGLAIIDEQHRFGVVQREDLLRKGRCPHLLVMTATPIPRTLALTVYGDLDVSVVGHSPPGRGRVRTFVRDGEALPRVWSFVRQQLTAGRQAYVVYPRVEGDEGGEVKAVTREFGRLQGVFAPFEVAFLHGRLPAAEKERVMTDFREGRVHVLLATSVIEVGVDVANATVMVIENAEQFGLAQLHQLRGRIGRGGHECYCVLVAGRQTPEARARLRVLEQCADGFAIAEADLRMRGPGEFLGQAQSGLPPFKFADLIEDRNLLELARQAVAERMGRG